MASEEKVLVIERKVLEQLGMFNGLVFDIDRYLRKIFAPGVPRFIPRSKAEKDPSYKQLIPYVIMSTTADILSYVRGRRAGETRLVGLKVHRHRRPHKPRDDMPLFNNNFYEAYLTAVEREVAEEVSVETTHTDRVVPCSTMILPKSAASTSAWSTIGLLDAPKVNRREQMITQMAFMTPAELQQVRDTMETWSALCLDNLSEMTNKIYPVR